MACLGYCTFEIQQSHAVTGSIHSIIEELTIKKTSMVAESTKVKFSINLGPRNMYIKINLKELLQEQKLHSK